MKTTVDLPDPLFRKAKARAAEKGISLKRFITEAVEKRLAYPDDTNASEPKPWMALLNELPQAPKKLLAIIGERVAEADDADLRSRSGDKS